MEENEVKSEVVNETAAESVAEDSVKEGTEEAAKVEAGEAAKEESGVENVKAKITSFLSSAVAMGKNLADSAVEKGRELQEKVAEKLAENEEHVEEGASDEAKAEEGSTEEAADKPETEEKQETMKDRVSSFLSSAAATSKNLADSAVEKVGDLQEKGREYWEKGMDYIEEKRREHDANDIYARLGKKVYKLVSRGELTLPECCEKYILELNELYSDEEEEEKACEQGECCECKAEKCECKAEKEEGEEQA